MIPSIALTSVRTSLRLVSLALFLAGLLPASAFATYISIYNTSGTDSATINLNSYGVSTISSLVVGGDAYGYDPNMPVNASADASLTAGSFYEYDSEYVPGYDTASAYAEIVVSGITKNANGEWIATEVRSRNGTYYNVNLGSGSIALTSSAGANGYGSTTAYAYLTY